MNYEEAIAWLNGERSMCNTFVQSGCAMDSANLLIAQADAAMVQQAYWVVKAHKEGMV